MPKPPQHPRKRACAECRKLEAKLSEIQRLFDAGLRVRDELTAEAAALRESVSSLEGEFQEFRVQAAENLEQAMSERDHYRILRDAASEASLRREADCLAIRTERDKVIDEMNNLIVKYNLPVLLRGSCGRRVL